MRKQVPSTKSQNQTRSQESEKSGHAGKPKGNVFHIIKRLLGYLSDYKGSMALLISGFIVSTALGLAPGWLIKLALDQYLVPEKVRYLWLVAATILGIGIFQGGIDFATRTIAESKGQKIVFDIRQSVYQNLMKQSFAYYDKTRIGDLMSRITADAETLQSFFGFASVHIIHNLLFILGILVILMFWSLEMTLLYILFIPFIILGISRYAFKVRPALGQTRRILGRLTDFIQEQLQGIMMIKIFDKEQATMKAFQKVNNQFMEKNCQAGRVTAFWMPYVFVLMGIGTGFIIWYGGINVISGTISLGTLVGFSTYLGMMMRPIRQTGMLINRVMVSSAAAERVFEVLDQEPDIKDMPGATNLKDVRGAVSYEHVSFAYEKNKPVLRDINFSVNPGETIALVGPTGVGKTTLVHLLPRYYDADEGVIRIDDKPVRTYTVSSLRQQIGIVMQHTFLFNLSIRDNIAFGKPGSSMDEIIQAAKDAEIHDFILTLPHQYETVVGERGVKLSGGQRQRISIARTLLMNPRILILDEPTASVDAQTDEKIRKALDRLCRDRTVLMIAHRLWTLRNADRILVLNEGTVEQYGTHDELISKPGLYQEIYHLQVDKKTYDIVENNQDTSGRVH
jgi:ABC-type multidrug transport system fused ATPase/permease subunit